jgi:hypothetical protein
LIPPKGEIRNTKLEIRNFQAATSTPQPAVIRNSFLQFEYSDLFRISDFGFRIFPPDNQRVELLATRRNSANFAEPAKLRCFRQTATLAQVDRLCDAGMSRFPIRIAAEAAA